MIQVENLTKVFGKGENAHAVVNNNTWTAKDGAITGFIGHNGAGKTTTLKMLTGVLNPTEGTMSLNGIDITKEPLKAKAQFGFVSDSPDHFLRLKGIEYLMFMANAYNVPEEKRMPFIKEYAHRFDIEDALGKTMYSYSHGMRQKIMIIGALIHNPSIWLLDEPMTGLDPSASYELKQMMIEHAQAGNSVLFSTHVLEVAEKLCDEIIIIKKGEIKYTGTLDNLRSTYPKDQSLEEIFLDINKDVESELMEANE